MTDAHYEALRLAALRPKTSGSARKCLLPFRLWPKPTPATPPISHRFSHPNDEFVKKLTHQHILTLGDQILHQLEINTERQIQRTCDETIEKERRRIEHEYHEKSNELLKLWKNQLEDEKKNLQKEFDVFAEKLEETRVERNRADQEALTRRMKDECNQALARQWQLAQEQSNLAVKRAEDQLRQNLELKHRQETQRFGQELIEQKEIEYKARESKALDTLRKQMNQLQQQNIDAVNQQHKEEIEELNRKLKIAEERFRREFTTRARLECDFRLLQADYKRFMDNSNVFHSDYMLKLYYIGEQIGDQKFEQILDKILAETNLLPQLPKYNDGPSQLSKIS